LLEGLYMNQFPLLAEYIEGMCLITTTDGCDFMIGKTPVTVGMWKEFCEATCVQLPEEPWWGWIDDHPMVNVSCNDVLDESGYCQWAMKMTNLTLSLPYDNQWMYVAKGGQKSNRYPWGSEFDPSKLWYSQAAYRSAKQTASVNRTDNIYQNSYGVKDLVGNCNEWCLTLMRLPNGTQFPFGREDYRVVKGGSWANYKEESFKCSKRFIYISDDRKNTVGFRIVSPVDTAHRI
jgi:formylglycine-generating enzyme required for sulfatase activity